MASLFVRVAVGAKNPVVRLPCVSVRARASTPFPTRTSAWRSDLHESSRKLYSALALPLPHAQVLTSVRSMAKAANSGAWYKSAVKASAYPSRDLVVPGGLPVALRWGREKLFQVAGPALPASSRLISARALGRAPCCREGSRRAEPSLDAGAVWRD